MDVSNLLMEGQKLIKKLQLIKEYVTSPKAISPIPKSSYQSFASSKNSPNSERKKSKTRNKANTPKSKKDNYSMTLSNEIESDFSTFKKAQKLSLFSSQDNALVEKKFDLFLKERKLFSRCIHYDILNAFFFWRRKTTLITRKRELQQQKSKNPIKINQQLVSKIKSKHPNLSYKLPDSSSETIPFLSSSSPDSKDYFKQKENPFKSQFSSQSEIIPRVKPFAGSETDVEDDIPKIYTDPHIHVSKAFDVSHKPTPKPQRLRFSSENSLKNSDSDDFEQDLYREQSNNVKKTVFKIKSPPKPKRRQNPQFDLSSFSKKEKSINKDLNEDNDNENDNDNDNDNINLEIPSLPHRYGSLLSSETSSVIDNLSEPADNEDSSYNESFGSNIKNQQSLTQEEVDNINSSFAIKRMKSIENMINPEENKKKSSNLSALSNQNFDKREKNKSNLNQNKSENVIQSISTDSSNSKRKLIKNSSISQKSTDQTIKDKKSKKEIKSNNVSQIQQEELTKSNLKNKSSKKQKKNTEENENCQTQMTPIDFTINSNGKSLQNSSITQMNKELNASKALSPIQKVEPSQQVVSQISSPALNNSSKDPKPTLNEYISKSKIQNNSEIPNLSPQFKDPKNQSQSQSQSKMQSPLLAKSNQDQQPPLYKFDVDIQKQIFTEQYQNKSVIDPTFENEIDNEFETSPRFNLDIQVQKHRKLFENLEENDQNDQKTKKHKKHTNNRTHYSFQKAEKKLNSYFSSNQLQDNASSDSASAYFDNSSELEEAFGSSSEDTQNVQNIQNVQDIQHIQNISKEEPIPTPTSPLNLSPPMSIFSRSNPEKTQIDALSIIPTQSIHMDDLHNSEDDKDNYNNNENIERQNDINEEENEFKKSIKTSKSYDIKTTQMNQQELDKNHSSNNVKSTRKQTNRINKPLTLTKLAHQSIGISLADPDFAKLHYIKSSPMIISPLNYQNTVNNDSILNQSDGNQIKNKQRNNNNSNNNNNNNLNDPNDHQTTTKDEIVDNQGTTQSDMQNDKPMYSDKSAQNDIQNEKPILSDKSTQKNLPSNELVTSQTNTEQIPLNNTTQSKTIDNDDNKRINLTDISKNSVKNYTFNNTTENNNKISVKKENIENNIQVNNRNNIPISPIQAKKDKSSVSKLSNMEMKSDTFSSTNLTKSTNTLQKSDRKRIPIPTPSKSNYSPDKENQNLPPWKPLKKIGIRKIDVDSIFNDSSDPEAEVEHVISEVHSLSTNKIFEEDTLYSQNSRNYTPKTVISVTSNSFGSDDDLLNTLPTPQIKSEKTKEPDDDENDEKNDIENEEEESLDELLNGIQSLLQKHGYKGSPISQK